MRNPPRVCTRRPIRADREFSRLDEAWCAALVQFVRMELHAASGDLTEATAVGHRALAAFRALGDQWGVSAIQFLLGMTLHRAQHRPATRLDRLDVQRAERRARALLGDAGFDAAHLAGGTEPHAGRPPRQPHRASLTSASGR